MTQAKASGAQTKMKPSDLNKQIVDLEKEFLELRMSKSAGQVKDASRFKKLRAEISRLKLKLSGE